MSIENLLGFPSIRKLEGLHDDAGELRPEAFMPIVLVTLDSIEADARGETRVRELLRPPRSIRERMAAERQRIVD